MGGVDVQIHLAILTSGKRSRYSIGWEDTKGGLKDKEKLKLLTLQRDK
jgi:hypothetical protein